MHFRLPRSAPFPIRRQAGGYCAEGPGFYVWDEDPGEVSRLAHELGRQLDRDLLDRGLKREDRRAPSHSAVPGPGAGAPGGEL